MRMSKEEYDLFNKRIREMNDVPEYLPSKENIDFMVNDTLDKFLPYLFWVYVRYPRTGDEEETEILELIRPLLKNIHVRSKKAIAN